MALFGRPTPKDDAKADDYRRWVEAREPLAIVSFVLGIFSLIEFGALIVFGVVGAIVGAIALRRLSSASSPRQGHVLAWMGIVTSVVSLLIAARFVYRWI